MEEEKESRGREEGGKGGKREEVGEEGVKKGERKGGMWRGQQSYCWCEQL